MWTLYSRRLFEAARSIAAVELVPFLSHRGFGTRRNAGFPPELVAVPQEGRVTVFISGRDHLALALNTFLAFGNKPIRLR